MEKIKKYSFVILLGLTCCFILINYHKAIVNPNGYLFSNHGDGIKNYFTYASHIKEASIVDTDLMNYPYGENYLYLDCQPILTVILQKISCIFPGIENYSIGIINFLMIISILLTAIFIYLILLQLKVDRLLSVLAAFSIAVLSPQIHRVTGHLALSYSFFIPLSWYLYLRFFNENNKIKWAIILSINILIWYFVHGYLGMILCFFFFLCFIIDYTLYKSENVSKLKYWLSFVIAVMLPLVLFWVYATVIDTHVGRTKDPWGFFFSRASLSSVFLPTHPPLNGYFNMLFKLNQRWEGWAYVGIGTTILCFLFIINWVWKLTKRKRFLFDSSMLFANRFLVVSLCAAIGLLIFSYALPFKWGMEFLLDWFRIIKNFRGIGRFAWVFYYVSTVSSVYFLYQLYYKKKQKFVLFLLILLPVSYFCEGVQYHRIYGEKTTQCLNLFNKKNLSKSMLNCIEIADSSMYQAIIPLPFYHIGSENYGKSATDKSYECSMILSYYSRLPLMSNYSTRTSILEAKKIMQIFSEDFYKKLIQEDIKSNKPFLIICSNDPLLEYEKKLVEKSEFLFSDINYSLYSITKERLFRDSSQEEIGYFINLKDQLHEKDNFLISSSDTSTVVIYKSYDEIPQETTLTGEGAFKGKFSNYNSFCNIPPGVLKENTDYIVSFWMYNEGENCGQDALSSNLFVQTDNGTNIEWIAVTNPANSIMIDGSWSLIELPFRISSNSDKVTINIKGDSFSKKYFYIDDLLIREKDNNVYRILEQENGNIKSLFKNNHRIRINK